MKMTTSGFEYKKFSEIDIGDPFFDSLKRDYPGTENSSGFTDWFKEKAQEGRKALVFEDEYGIGAFIVLKDEREAIELGDRTLPEKERIKISTFRVAERYQGKRIGEGALGLVLWKWRDQAAKEIYVTTFSKQKSLISLFLRFGFVNCGQNKNGEEVFIKSRVNVDLRDPYKAFPFVLGNFSHAGYVIIDDTYHDTMFAYFELANNKKELKNKLGLSVRNGLTKVYVGRASTIDYYINEPVFIYRKYTGERGSKYRSCVTSYCIVTNAFQAKRNNQILQSFEELKERITNKAIFNEEELKRQYESYRNLTIVELLYCGYFGAGKNVNMDWLKNNGFWVKNEGYPTKIHLSNEQFQSILKEGGVNVSNIIIN